MKTSRQAQEGMRWKERSPTLLALTVSLIDGAAVRGDHSGTRKRSSSQLHDLRFACIPRWDSDSGCATLGVWFAALRALWSEVRVALGFGVLFRPEPRYLEVHLL